MKLSKSNGNRPKPGCGRHGKVGSGSTRRPKGLKNLPVFDRPREKLVAKGVKALSDTELLAIMLGSGIPGKDVFQIARVLVKKLNKSEAHFDLKTLLSVDGVGFAKACQVVASFEFARRRIISDGLFIQTAEDILPLISHISDKKQEHLCCVSLNGANEVIGNRLITVGLLTTNQVHPREVFAEALSERAASVILAHNHPSGILKPSPDDLAATRRLVDAGKILGISVLDHIIVSKKGYLSLKEAGFNDLF